MTPQSPEDDHAEAERQLALLEQLPREAPPVPFDMADEFPELDNRPEYSTAPSGLRTMSVSKRDYPDKAKARLKLRELCLRNGERIWSFFETGGAWVAQVYKPRITPFGQEGF